MLMVTGGYETQDDPGATAPSAQKRKQVQQRTSSTKVTSFEEKNDTKALPPFLQRTSDSTEKRKSDSETIFLGPMPPDSNAIRTPKAPARLLEHHSFNSSPAMNAKVLQQLDESSEDDNISNFVDESEDEYERKPKKKVPASWWRCCCLSPSPPVSPKPKNEALGTKIMLDSGISRLSTMSRRSGMNSRRSIGSTRMSKVPHCFTFTFFTISNFLIRSDSGLVHASGVD